MKRKEERITERLKKAVGLFTILPATMIPTAMVAQSVEGDADAIRVGGRISVRARRVEVDVRPRLSIRVQSVRKIEDKVSVRVLTPNFDIKQ